MGDGQANESERLPWLEPYREPAASPRPRLREVEKKPAPAAAPTLARPAGGDGRGAYVLGAIGGLSLAALIGVIGYGVGRQQAPAQPPAVSVAIPPVTSDRPRLDYPDIVAGGEPAAAPVDARDASAVRAAPHRVAHRPTARARRAAQPVARPAGKSLHVPPPPPRAAPPAPKPRIALPIAPLPVAPPPVAGRAGEVVRVGYYVSPRHAEAAYRRARARYPYLGGLPKVVAPVEMAGRGTVYALRLGAGSAGNARNTCRYMRRAALTCTVE